MPVNSELPEKYFSQFVLHARALYLHVQNLLLLLHDESMHLLRPFMIYLDE